MALSQSMLIELLWSHLTFEERKLMPPGLQI
jgi:hypothetical protein